ncbi:Type I restriction-modification system,restriction subunit R [Helicobacter mustelae]|uniref:type I restriction endonuclease subunit R n=1 Tax=Helicobacter mustelae TaxID=217 RepID=UPI000E01CDDD|nr:type I restriction endonuclease [Helicobacter mustelae]STP14179.1 Type I restriction-modification system,restriction subunit R [Helicobacter mustelae]
MRNYTEKDLESFIENHLITQNGYIKAEDADYDKGLCLDCGLVLRFLEATQKEKLRELQKRVGANYEDILLKRISHQIKEKGILEALRSSCEANGVKFSLAYPKPNTNANEDAIENYDKNIFSITRQLHYSQANQKSLDMVIFLNGIPIITMELKNPLTGQNVYHAIEQYKKDRNPKEPLFSACIVHFALDSDSVYMSTKLEGTQTLFLPFNRGLNDGSGMIGVNSGAGNPPSDGIKTAYLWERILSKDTLLSLIFDFVQNIHGRVIFPRYHQLDVVEKLIQDVQKNDASGRYLIQHSAGSGKSNSISWLAYSLVGLHRQNERGAMEVAFDSVIIVTDRRVLDAQIQENVKSFAHEKGVVEAITEGSRQLKDALKEGKKIIISTIQKFPYILDDIRDVRGKRFAILIDEAHSSQGGTSAQSLGEAIRDRGAQDDGQDAQDLEDRILETIKDKKLPPNASYFAFTATPKPKTLEMFGIPIDLEGTKKFLPFHLYSMKQAIQEGFILDVLRGYTTYKSYYKIASTTQEDKRFDKQKSLAKIKTYVESDPNVIAKKAEIMIDHFASKIYKKIGGRAKAMVVTSSRQSALKYFFAFQKYLRENSLPYQALVAFSGEVMLDGQSYSESALNGIPETRLKEEFQKDSYRFLIVAEKYQTGFDEPLLHTMYVDKKLSGVSTVQTLSRLNRTCKNKEDTCVMDFVNSHEDIGRDFGTFYEQTFLGEETDPNQIYDLKSSLNEYEIYTQQDINLFVDAFLNSEKEDKIHALLDRLVERYNCLEDEKKSEFYTKARNYLKEYSFLAQILPYEDSDLEKLSILLKKLITKLMPPRGEDLAMGILEHVDFDSYRVQLDKTLDISLEAKGELKPSQADGTSKSKESVLEELMEIVREFNQRNGEEIDWDEDDKLKKSTGDLIHKMQHNESLAQTAEHSDEQNTRIKFNGELKRCVLESMDELPKSFFMQFFDNKEFQNAFKQKMFHFWYGQNRASARQKQAQELATAL